LPFRRLADKDFALLGERDNAGSEAVAFRVGDHFGLGAFHDRDDRIRGAKVDADDLFAGGHTCSSVCWLFGLLIVGSQRFGAAGPANSVLNCPLDADRGREGKGRARADEPMAVDANL